MDFSYRFEKPLVRLVKRRKDDNPCHLLLTMVGYLYLQEILSWPR